jgi:hypothetical protein
MASGFGYAGTISTCYKPFEDFTLCMVRSECAMDKLTGERHALYLTFFSSFVVQKTSSEPKAECGALRNGYLECLHKFNEVLTRVYCYMRRLHPIFHLIRKRRSLHGKSTRSTRMEGPAMVR